MYLVSTNGWTVLTIVTEKLHRSCFVVNIDTPCTPFEDWHSYRGKYSKKHLLTQFLYIHRYSTFSFLIKCHTFYFDNLFLKPPSESSVTILNF